MIGLTPQIETRTPLSRPSRTPVSSAQTIATPAGSPARSISAITMPDTAATVYCDRSMAARIMATVMPKAMIALMDV